MAAPGRPLTVLVKSTEVLLAVGISTQSRRPAERPPVVLTKAWSRI